MYPSRAGSKGKKRQKGVGLPAALFIIVILALLAIAITELEQSTAAGVSINVQSSRAFYAAESALQAALVELFPVNTGDPTIPADPTACVTPSVSFTTPGLAGCTGTVQCSIDVVDGESYFTLRSTGTCGSGGKQAIRAVEVRAH